MGIAKIIGGIFGILIILLIVAGIDVYLSVDTIRNQTDDFKVSDPTFELADTNDSVIISIEVDSPKLGFIPKGINVEVTIMKNGVVYDKIEDTLDLGKKDVITFNMTIESADATTIATGGSVVLSAEIKITPVLFGIKVPFSKDLDPVAITLER
ncbi:MAG: hypothetical protein KAR35_04715 [Candidatus Heimdallarchaeota archaeon]|nr:hypothetical protein [Candidatus Heimdallarchaeota archaeon]MCK5048658.1 hypothetical protein [Candidatus Heimdallarchaeota archaeon]